MWVNSLVIEPKLRNFKDASDGLLILKLVSYIDSEAVDLKKLITPATSKQDVLQNIQLALNACYRVTTKTSSATALKVYEGDRVVIVGLLYQLMRSFYQRNINMVLEQDLVEWANSKVESSQIDSFTDDSLSDGLYLLLLLDSLSNSVDW